MRGIAVYFFKNRSFKNKISAKFDLSNNLSNSNKFSINDLGNIYSKENIDISKNFNINNGVFSADVSGNIIVNGFIIDARRASYEIQEQAYRAGIIPYIPSNKTTA